MEHLVFSIAVCLWGLGFLLLPRLRRRCTSTPANAIPRVSVVIPARNEAHNLPTLLKSLALQPVKLHEIIVVDDGSTDDTARVAGEHGARVLASQPLPDGWRGKAWACYQGAQAATGDVLLFLDADTWFEPGGLALILGAYRGGAFSVGPYHVVQKAYENLSLFFNLNMAVGTVPNGLFGQFLLVERSAYGRVGGHSAVKNKILENSFLARHFRKAGVPTSSVSGRGTFCFRMYPNGLAELVEGWTKGFASGAGQTPRVVLLIVVAWMTGLMLAPIGLVVAENWPLWSIAYLVSALQVGWLARQVGSFHWLSALLYPVPLLFFFALFAWSSAMSGKQVKWKGRRIRAD